MGHRPDHWPAVHTDFFSGQRLPICNRVGLFVPPFQAEGNTAGNAAYNNATFASGINFPGRQFHCLSLPPLLFGVM